MKTTQSPLPTAYPLTPSPVCERSENRRAILGRVARQSLLAWACSLAIGGTIVLAQDQPNPNGPKQGDAKRIELGEKTTLEVLYIPPGEFMMGSTPEEKAWATGIEGGATPGTTRESFEGEKPRLMRVKQGFWMGRTEVTVGQFRRFTEESGYVTDAEKPDGETQVFDPKWDGYHLTTNVVHPWESKKGKSWRDPNWAFPNRDDFPVVCVSYTDMKAFCRWLTEREAAARRLPEGMEYRLPTEAEWEYACRGGSKESLYFWWGNELEAGEGRLNISAMDLLPGRTKGWPLAKAPWSDGFSFVSPVDHYGEKGRNGFGMADMCGGVWEFVIDHFDPTGGHEEIYYEDPAKLSVSRPVCRGGNYFDVPGNARCAVRLGIRDIHYSDSRDGFRICLGRRVPDKPAK
jgi:formylglycine-generating enzyme required for sulfatase activity